MKILESAPSRYDRGIRILFFGTLNRLYDQLIKNIEKGQMILDIGCGTGALTIRAAQSGARIKGIDINPQMLEIAQKKIEELKLIENITLYEMGVAELENEKSQYYDVVMSGLCFSELTENEINFTLKQVNRILKPEGRLMVVDEVLPDDFFKRFIYWLVKFPVKIVTYIITQTSTHALKKFPQKIQAVGYKIETIKYNKLSSLIILTCRRSEGDTN